MSEKPIPEGGWWPSWRFGPDGEGREFACADDVPEGWEDHPSKFGENLDTPPPDAPGALSLSRAQVIAGLKDRNAKVDVKLPTATLYAQLVDLVEAST